MGCTSVKSSSRSNYSTSGATKLAYIYFLLSYEYFLIQAHISHLYLHHNNECDFFLFLFFKAFHSTFTHEYPPWQPQRTCGLNVVIGGFMWLQ